MTRSYFPMFADVTHARFLMVGAGDIALAKLETLLDFTRQVTVLAPSAIRPLEACVQQHQLRWQQATFTPADVEAFDIVIAATNQPEVNAAVAAAARQHGKLVNVVDAPELSNFIFGATIKTGKIVVSVSTSGLAPVLARLIKQGILRSLPRNLQAHNDFLIEHQRRVREALPAMQARRLFWQEAFEGKLGEALEEGDLERARQGLEQLLKTWDGRQQALIEVVGTGPGAADLLTLRALRSLSRADDVVYEQGVGPDVLEYARRDARKTHLPGDQREAVEMMIRSANDGRRVVLLLTGDPSHRRVMKELARHAEEQGIAFKMVPGVPLSREGT